MGRRCTLLGIDQHCIIMSGSRALNLDYISERPSGLNLHSSLIWSIITFELSLYGDWTITAPLWSLLAKVNSLAETPGSVCL